MMLTSIALLLAMGAGQPSDRFNRCMAHAGAVSADMLDCGAAEIARVDRRLNVAYRQLLDRLPASGQRRLRAEQRVWLMHHLLETKRLARDPNEGSMAFIQSQGFELQDLKERVNALERRLASLR